MNLWETMTGSDLTREWRAFEARAGALPADYRAAWEEIKVHLFRQHSRTASYHDIGQTLLRRTLGNVIRANRSACRRHGTSPRP
jgi:DNA-binding ferritin-like protein (Dps family)